MSGILQSQNVYHGEWGHWISAHVLATIVILWISYDTELLAHKMDPSEWSQCIVFFVSFCHHTQLLCLLLTAPFDNLF